MKRIVILGAGESGAGAAVLAKKEGFDVFVSDMSKIADKYKKLMDDHQIEWEEGHHTDSMVQDTEKEGQASTCVPCHTYSRQLPQAGFPARRHQPIYPEELAPPSVP